MFSLGWVGRIPSYFYRTICPLSSFSQGPKQSGCGHKSYQLLLIQTLLPAAIANLLCTASAFSFLLNMSDLEIQKWGPGQSRVRSQLYRQWIALSYCKWGLYPSLLCQIFLTNEKQPFIYFPISVHWRSERDMNQFWFFFFSKISD